MKSLKNLDHSLTVVVFLALISLTACAGKASPGAKEVGADTAVPTDLTRPPVTISENQDREKESNPDETISFEKWNKEQQSIPEGDE